MHTKRDNNLLPTPPDDSFESEQPSLEGSSEDPNDATAGRTFASFANTNSMAGGPDSKHVQEEATSPLFQPQEVTDVGFQRKSSGGRREKASM